MTTTDDAITERIPLPRPSDALHGDGPAPRRRTSSWRWARLVVVAVVVAVLAAAAGVFIGLVLLPPTPPVSPAVPVATAGPGPVAQPALPSLVAPSTSARAASSCPRPQQLLEVFARASPEYGTGARATGDVVCAGGYAVLTLRSPTTPDGLQTIYEVGPPVRFRNAGTGPICSDGSEDEGVVVPRSAATRLGCLTSGAASAGRSSGSSRGGPAPSSGDPYGCLAERAAQERSYDTDTPIPNSRMRCNYNYGPTLPSTRETCWLADYDRDRGSGPPDERGRRDFEEGCAPFGY